MTEPKKRKAREWDFVVVGKESKCRLATVPMLELSPETQIALASLNIEYVRVREVLPKREKGKR